jgi:hypothetical protein
MLFRSDKNFAWYQGGSFASGELDAGGGTTLMQLHGNSGDLYVKGAYNMLSDRGAKENFKPVDAAEILARVAALPVESWCYKDNPGVCHLGPMAQDFRPAFGLGADDKHIAVSDLSGVALAAIQGLNQKLEDAVRERDARIQALEESVAELKALVGKLAGPKAGGAR